MYVVRLAILCLVVLFVAGCDDKSSTSVNVQSFLMDAAAFDLEAVVAKLEEGKLANAQELEKFINETAGVNNVDLDKDGAVDELTVKEEKGGDGNVVMAVVAHPKKGEETVVTEISFQKKAGGEVEVSGAYPEYVRGYEDHYYRHTLTGSVVGDMMFYSWLYSPHPLYVPSYRYGMYYSSPRHVMSSSRLSTSRTTYRKTTKMSPVKKQARPSSYKPSSKIAQKSSSRFKKSTGGSTLSSKKGTSKSFTKRTGTKSKATGFGASKSKSGSSWGSSSRKSGFGSSRRSSFGSRRR